MTEGRIKAIVDAVRHHNEPTTEEKLGELQRAVRALRDDWLRGDDKCWLDLENLFGALPEGFVVPARDTAVELANCERYIASCHHPDVEYVSPQRRIEELESEVRQLRALVQTVGGAL